MIRTQPTDPARRVAAVVCGLEALVLAGFAAFYLKAMPEAADPARVATEAALIVLAAVGMAALSRLWVGTSSWPGTPTVVWHVLLIPVIVPMFQAGQLLIALGLSAAVLVAVGAVMAQRRNADEPYDEPDSTTSR